MSVQSRQLLLGFSASSFSRCVVAGLLPFHDPECEDEGELAPIKEVDEELSTSQNKTSEEETSPSQPDTRSHPGSQSQDPNNQLTVSQLLKLKLEKGGGGGSVTARGEGGSVTARRGGFCYS